MKKAGAGLNETVYFTYGAGAERYLKETSEGKYTFYLGKAYEEQIEDNTEKQICYISLGGKTIGTHIEVKDTDYVNTNPMSCPTVPMDKPIKK